jgi:hypothetical protein
MNSKSYINNGSKHIKYTSNKIESLNGKKPNTTQKVEYTPIRSESSTPTRQSTAPINYQSVPRQSTPRNYQSAPRQSAPRNQTVPRQSTPRNQTAPRQSSPRNQTAPRQSSPRTSINSSKNIRR